MLSSVSFKVALAVLEEYLKPKLLGMLEPPTRAGLTIDFFPPRRRPCEALNSGYTLQDVVEAQDMGRERQAELHFGVCFHEEYLYKDVAPRLVHPSFFGQRVFQRLVRKPGRQSGVGREGLGFAGHTEPFSAFSMFNSKHGDSHPFGRSYFESLLPRLESQAGAREDSAAFSRGQPPQNFQDFAKLLGETEAIPRLDPANIRSVKPREDPTALSLARRNDASANELPFSEDSLKFRGPETPNRPRSVRYDEDVRRLLHKI